MKRICFVGDSITEGHSDNARLGWVGRLVQNVPIDFGIYNLGVSGQTLAEIQARAKDECRARLDGREFKGIVLGAGLNDFNIYENGDPRTPLGEVKSSLNTLLDDLKNIAPLIVIGPFPVAEEFNPFFTQSVQANVVFTNALIEEADQFYAGYCATKNIPYLSMINTLLDSDYMTSLRENDGIHPHGDGYQIAANIIQKWDAWQELSRAPEIIN